MPQTGIRASLYRGGTSKGLFFLAKDLPQDPETRDRVLLAAMGSPDARQIDGLGGADPLTSKVAVISPPSRPDADVDYLFLQVAVDKGVVSDRQNCGNILAAVGPFAIEHGMIPAGAPHTAVRIHMVNTGAVAVAQVATPEGAVEYEGETRIAGVPRPGAAIPIEFLDLAGSACGALLPTGRVAERIDGVELTCIDNGMPVCLVRAADLGVAGDETPEALEANAPLKARVEALRLAVGPAMNLGDVSDKTVPKMCLVSPAAGGGALNTRTFIPHRVHKSIGVFGAVSVATAACLPGSVAASVLRAPIARGVLELDVEHPTGALTIRMEVEGEDQALTVRRASFVRTARRLMSGEVFVPAAVWPGAAELLR